ncbi:unnamed protein product [Eruca vesicaria subsp. sativa]|uniref:Uncharacterized protein n=1 Tax=Eruca vesicaria subsp. sativa TaxID=29727 RepID=A0ABC8JJF8_ERUVS|nr:unnamed protein product [Eruca vesicaria subsp. sativa]
MIKNTPEWEVRLTNPCYCYAQDIVLACVGLKSLTPIDRSKISISGNECKVFEGVADRSEIVFKYVWAEKFDIKILSGSIACS